MTTLSDVTESVADAIENALDEYRLSGYEHSSCLYVTDATKLAEAAIESFKAEMRKVVPAVSEYDAPSGFRHWQSCAWANAINEQREQILGEDN